MRAVRAVRAVRVAHAVHAAHAVRAAVLVGLVVPLCVVLSGAGPVQAAPAAPPATSAPPGASAPTAGHAEIEALLELLSRSGCLFNRNGSWHSAAEARRHLAAKLEYLQRRGLVQTAEHFIERGASSSSLSGRPYLVQCGTAEPVESAQWLAAQLERLRIGGRGAAPTRK